MFYLQNFQMFDKTRMEDNHRLHASKDRKNLTTLAFGMTLTYATQHVLMKTGQMGQHFTDAVRSKTAKTNYQCGQRRDWSHIDVLLQRFLNFTTYNQLTVNVKVITSTVLLKHNIMQLSSRHFSRYCYIHPQKCCRVILVQFTC